MAREPMIGVRVPHEVLELIDDEVRKNPGSGGREYGRSAWVRNLIYAHFDIEPEERQKVDFEKAEEIRALLSSTNLTTTEVAERFGITPSYVSYIRAGKRLVEPTYGLPPSAEDAPQGANHA